MDSKQTDRKVPYTHIILLSLGVCGEFFCCCLIHTHTHTHTHTYIHIYMQQPHNSRKVTSPTLMTWSEFKVSSRSDYIT